MQVKWSDILMMEHTIDQNKNKNQKNKWTQPHTNSMTMKIILFAKWKMITACCCCCCYMGRNVCAKRYQRVKRETVTSLASIILVFRSLMVGARVFFFLSSVCLGARVLVCCSWKAVTTVRTFSTDNVANRNIVGVPDRVGLQITVIRQRSLTLFFFFIFFFFWFIFCGLIHLLKWKLFLNRTTAHTQTHTYNIIV